MKLSTRSIYIVLLTLNLIFLTWLLFFYHSVSFSRIDASQEFHHNFVPLKSMRQMFRFAYSHNFKHGTLRYLITNLFGNIIFWMPLGYLANKLQLTRSGIKLFLVAVGFCVFTEFLQLLTNRGNFDADDVLLNTLGLILGYQFSLFLRR